MLSEAWSWIRGLSDIVTLIQFAGSVGVAGLLAIVGQGALSAALDFSPILRFLLAVCIFLLILAVVLAILKAVLEQRPSIKQENVATVSPSDTSLQQSRNRGGSALHPVIQDHELAQRHIANRTIYMAEFAREVGTTRWREAVVNGRTFEDCRIIGPAVLLPMNTGKVGTTFDDDCTWDESVDAFWAPDHGLDQKYTGIVGLEDCIFLRCRFTNVGVMTSPQTVRELRDAIYEEEDGDEATALPPPEQLEQR